MMLQLLYTFFMEEKVVHKTTARKTTVRRVASKTIPARTVAKAPTAVSLRKAPPRKTPEPVVQRSRSPKVFFIGCLLFLILIGVSFLIGSTDKGELDVAKKIADRKENATPEEKVTLENVNAPKPQGVPTASLVGTGKGDTQTTPADVQQVGTSTDVTTASSTDTVATTTMQTGEQSESTPVTNDTSEQVQQ